MKVIFKSVRYKNVLSSGNMWTEVSLCGSPSTMIIGNNGAGKSTVLEAIFFAGWGRAYRNINMDQLVNLKNQRELLVELSFTSGDRDVMVRRGMMPDVFEIFVDGEQLQAPSSKKLFQQQLTGLLGIDRDTAAQILFVSKTQHLPFMRLDAAKRRQFVENILNLTIFQGMVKIKDARLGRAKTKIGDLKLAWQGSRDKAKVRNRYVADLVELNEQTTKRARDEADRKIAANLEQIKSNSLEIESLTLTYPKGDHQKLISEREGLRNDVSDARAQVRHLTKLIKDHKETCPTCGQAIKGDHETFLADRRKELDEANAKVVSLSELLDKSDDELKDFERQERTVKANLSRVDLLEKSNKSLAAENEQIEKSISEAKDMSGEIEKVKKEVEELQEISEQLKERLGVEIDQESILKVVSLILSDKGLKAAIIARMIPVLNQFVNENLSRLGLFVSFHLDENFSETIRYRGFDTLSYNSFSEGEKLRIDMAVLLAWRQLAQVNGAFTTNLLFFDEVFDSSLDIDGAAALTDVLEQSEDMNVFVITHTPEKIADRVKSVLKFKRIDGYSQIALNV